ncbi:MAG: hypothetical protein R2791_00010, partial [Saprospiraceae bacterium]
LRFPVGSTGYKLLVLNDFASRVHPPAPLQRGSLRCVAALDSVFLYLLVKTITKGASPGN